jgi:transmembrane sensor
MGILSRFLHRPRGPEEEIDKRLDELLEGDARRFASLDPETASRWRSLRSTLESAPHTVQVSRHPARARILWPAVSFAALATALIAVGILTRHPGAALNYQTGRGEQSTVVLADSTEVSLNHTSLLTVATPGQKGERHVQLQGEAFFRVRKNGTRFTVSTDLGTVEVLGTEFNVRTRDNRLEVAVVAGSVRITVQRDGRDSSVVLGTGQIALCSAEGYPGEPAPLRFDEYPGWMHKKILLYRRTLRSICEEIESQFDVRVAVENSALLDETVTGSVDARTVQDALTTLGTLTGSRFRHDKNGYTLY